MNAIQSINRNETVVIRDQERLDAAIRQSRTTAPQSDVTGVTSAPIPIQDHTLPPIAASRADLQQALATLQGKSSAIQEALAMVAALYAPKEPGAPATSANDLNNMVNELFQAATTGGSSAALNVFCRELQDMIAQAGKQCQGNTAVANVCSTAYELIDLLSNPESAQANAEAINAKLARLLRNEGSTDEAVAALAKGLGVIFGAALSAVRLSNDILELLNEGMRNGTIVLTKTPHAAEVSGLITVMAMMTLLTLVSSRISEELDARLSLSEEADKLRKEQMQLLEKQQEARTSTRRDETVVEQANSASALNAALSKSFGEGLSGGMSDAFALLNNKIIEARQRARPRMEA